MYSSTLPTVVIYGAILVSACARIAAPVFPAVYFPMLCVAAIGWFVAFGGFTAVNNVSFKVDKGEILGLIGPNGSGKSTIFNMLSGTLVPTAGSILFDGVEIAGVAPHRIINSGVGRTFQIPRPFHRLSIFENVALAVAPAANATSAVFSYTIGATDASTPDLNVTGLALTGTTPALRDAAGNDVVLALPVGSNLADGKDIRIDTVLPTAPGVPDMLASSDTGLYDNDNVTSNRQPVFHVSIAATNIEVGDTLQLMNGTTVIGGHVVDATDLAAGSVDLAPTAAMAA